MRYRGRCYIFFACLLAAAGCMAGNRGPAGEAGVTAVVLQTGRQCAASGNDWHGTWITSPMALREWMTACRSNVIGSRQDHVPAVDFERFGVLALEMGIQKSAGYGFDTAGVKVHVTDRTAMVEVACYRPGPGAMTAQVITSPWILIQMPLEGFDRIRVTDQDVRLLLKIERP